MDALHVPCFDEIVAMVQNVLKREGRADLLKPEFLGMNSLYAHAAGDMGFLTVGVFFFFFCMAFILIYFF